MMSQCEAEQRRIRERAHARRKRELGFSLIRLGEEVAHADSAAEHKRLVEQGLEMLLDSVRLGPTDDAKRQAIAQHFQDCAYREDYLNDVRLDGNSLKLEGSFDIRKLAQRMLWTGVEEQFRTVEDNSEEPKSRWGYDSGFEVAVRLLAEMGEEGKKDELIRLIVGLCNQVIEREEEKLDVQQSS